LFSIADREFVASIADRESKDGSEQSNSCAIAYDRELLTEVRRKHKFGKNEFSLPDFEFVSGCAYFNYHRDKINVRSSKRSLSTKLRSARKRPLRAKANKHVEIRCKRCPHCNNRRLLEVLALSTRRIDMKFFGGGVNKLVTIYSSWKYRCSKCGKTFIPPDYPKIAMRYGNGLANWVVYQNVALGQNVLKVKQGLQQVFKLDVPQPTIYRFKAAVANRYKATNISILDDLLGGPSLSIDETEVRLVNATGHVWVFAGISGAYYEYRESPNGQFLTERL
jgi:DNA-directed RNA polymerase subunit RPC12/RpoP